MNCICSAEIDAVEASILPDQPEASILPDQPEVGILLDQQEAGILLPDQPEAGILPDQPPDNSRLTDGIDSEDIGVHGSGGGDPQELAADSQAGVKYYRAEEGGGWLR